MNMKGIGRLWLLVGLVASNLLAACTQVHTEATYVELSLDQRVEGASIVAVGKVTDISETLWNQDNGQYWEEPSDDGGTIYTAISYYTVDIEVSQFVVADVESATITVVGVGDSVAVGEGQDGANGGLEVGDEVIVFAQRTELAWRGEQTRPILELMGVPTESYLIKGADGLYHSNNSSQAAISLDELMAKVATQRVSEE